MAKVLINKKNNLNLRLFDDCQKYLVIIETEKPLERELAKEFQDARFWRVTRSGLMHRNDAGTDGFAALVKQAERVAEALSKLGY